MANRKRSNRIISVLLTVALALGLFPLFGTAANGALMGDVDYDGSITASDARLTLRSAVGLEDFNSVQTALADLDGDKTTSAADARLALRTAVGLENSRRSAAPLKTADAATAALLLPQENVESDCHAEHYEMKLKLDTKARTVGGTALIQIKNKTNALLDTLCFRLFSASITEGSGITAAGNANGRQSYKFHSEEDPSVIYVDLEADAINPGDILTVALDFTSVIPKIDDRFGYHFYKDGGLFNLTFCFPQLSMRLDGKWDTDPYYEAGETTFNEMSDYDVTLTAPASYHILSTGVSATEKGVTKIHAENVREMAITACSFGEIKETTAGGVRFRILTPTYRGADDPYSAALYDMLLQTAVASVAYYTEKLGPYIYDELDIIPLALTNTSGMEMPGLIYIGITPDLSAYDDFAFVYDTVAHEVAHEWFYCAVGNDQYDDAWLDEAFATFCASEYLLQINDARAAVDAMIEQYPDAAYSVDDY